MTRHTQREPFPPRWAFLVLALLILGGLGFTVYNQMAATADKNTAQANAQTLSQDIQQVCQTQGKLMVEDRDLCAKAESVQQKPTEAIPGPKGDPGTPGRDGIDGAPGKDSAIAGPAGAAGVAGAASTIPGPAGPQGPQGPPGADSLVPGPAGPQGPAGPAGNNGTAGPAPSSFTFTDPKTGTTYTCTPNPPGSSTYTCSSGGLIP